MLPYERQEQLLALFSRASGSDEVNDKLLLA